MKRFWLLVLLAYIFPQPSYAKPDDKVGHWQLIVTEEAVSDQVHLPNPQVWWQFGDQSTSSYGHYSYIVTITDHVIDHVDSGREGCIAQVPSSNGCDFIDYYQLTKIDDHNLRVDAENHGGRGGIPMHIWEKDYITKTITTDGGDWIVGHSFVVAVPKAQTSAVVIGTFGPDQVLFSPSATLDPSSSKYFTLVKTFSVPDTDYYEYQVKDYGTFLTIKTAPKVDNSSAHFMESIIINPLK